jgi:hypothetical protein
MGAGNRESPSVSAVSHARRSGGRGAVNRRSDGVNRVKGAARALGLLAVTLAMVAGPVTTPPAMAQTCYPYCYDPYYGVCVPC